jgi:hypothetical protein
LAGAEWLKEYYARVTEEYKFSMERKDRVTDWAIGIFFVALVAYSELLRENVPSIWRVYLVVGLLAFIIRLFSSSCLAYAYLKKWRYILDSIEKHWMMNTPPYEALKDQIDKLHHTPRTTEKRSYFVRKQLVSGFFLLLAFPFALLLFELFSHTQGLSIAAPLVFLVGYCIYESVLFTKTGALRGQK